MQSETLDDIKTSLKIYQELQIIASVYNNIHRSIIIPAYILISVVVISVPAFVLMAYFDDVGLFPRVLFSLGPLFGVLIIFCWLRYPITIVSRSAKELRKAKLCLWSIPDVKNERTSRKVLRCCLRSLNTIRIAYIQNSYFHSNTPLMLLNLSIRLAIRLTLVKRGH